MPDRPARMIQPIGPRKTENRIADFVRGSGRLLTFCSIFAKPQPIGMAKQHQMTKIRISPDMSAPSVRSPAQMAEHWTQPAPG
jgi:hypothetical protein